MDKTEVNMSPAVDALKTPSLPSVGRALEILEHIAGSRNGLTLTQLTRLLGFPRSTVHCLLLTLERSGYIERATPRGPYLCGPRLVELSGKALGGGCLREAGLPVLRGVSDRTRLISHIAMLERDQVTIIAQLAPPGARLTTTVGQRLELHCTALGKAILAWLPEARLRDLLRARSLAAHNDKTIVSLRRFEEELAATRRRGYAVDDEEDTIGWRCLAAPVLDAAGVPIAAISVMGSTLQVTEHNAERIGGELVRSAARLSRNLRLTAGKAARTA
jgi:DNA-binding IclR family transcriptional regulator